jgi:hypothetical protein
MSHTLALTDPVFLNVYGAPELIPRNEISQPVFLNVYGAQESNPRNEFRDGICDSFMEPRNLSQPWRAGTATLFVVPARQTT